MMANQLIIFLQNAPFGCHFKKEMFRISRGKETLTLKDDQMETIF